MPTGEAAKLAGRKGSQNQGKDSTDKGAGSLAGNLTKDPALKYTDSGKAVVTLGVACNERVKDASTGEWKDGETTFFDVQAWGNLAENITQHLQKGDRIVCEGRWQSQTWTDKDEKVQERIVLVARDLGPSMMFKAAQVIRPQTGGR